MRKISRTAGMRGICLVIVSLFAGLAYGDNATPDLSGDTVHASPSFPVERVAQGDFSLVLPLGLSADDFFIPRDNPMTAEKVALGRSLFFDVRLSIDNTIACASCHRPDAAFGDNRPLSIGVNGKAGIRNSPAIINRFMVAEQFWDGRAATLEAQIRGPLLNPAEMAMPDLELAVDRIASIKGYETWFRRVFGRPVNIDDMARAIAAFERTLLSGNSRWDRYRAGDDNALSALEKRGLDIFQGKGRCLQCHGGSNLTDEGYHNIGVGWNRSLVDTGRYGVTKKAEQMGAFKTPTLREIGRTAPYMHDGSLGSLKEVVDFYNEGGIDNPFLDAEMRRVDLSLEEILDAFNKGEGMEKVTRRQIRGLGLTGEEKAALIAFLESLGGEGWQAIRAPATFPE